jgi:hypothetical protein
MSRQVLGIAWLRRTCTSRILQVRVTTPLDLRRVLAGGALKTLVTGGAGYVGNLLSKALLEAGHEVTAMDNLAVAIALNSMARTACSFCTIWVRIICGALNYIIPSDWRGGARIAGVDPADAQYPDERIARVSRLAEKPLDAIESRVSGQSIFDDVYRVQQLIEFAQRSHRLGTTSDMAAGSEPHD